MFSLTFFGMLNLKTVMKGMIGHSYQEKLATQVIYALYSVSVI